MKILFDFFPIALFFIVYKLSGLYIATFAAIVLSILQVLGLWIFKKRVEKLHIITLILILLLGSATLFFQDEMFIKWKPTVLNWLFAGIFAFSHFFNKETLLEKLMSHQVSLPKVIWLKLNLSWIIYFFILGAINLYIVYNYDTNTWVNFKFFGMMGLTILFVVIQAIYMTQYLNNHPSSNSHLSK